MVGPYGDFHSMSCDFHSMNGNYIYISNTQSWGGVAVVGPYGDFHSNLWEIMPRAWEVQAHCWDV